MDRVAREVVDASIRVHRALGPGLLESVYEQCLAFELEERGIQVKRQVLLPITYRGVLIEAGFRMDLLVGDVVVVEIKSVESLLPVHEAQLLTYLKMSRLPIGLLLNFNVSLMKRGIRRFVHSV